MRATCSSAGSWTTFISSFADEPRHTSTYKFIDNFMHAPICKPLYTSNKFAYDAFDSRLTDKFNRTPTYKFIGNFTRATIYKPLYMRNRLAHYTFNYRLTDNCAA